MKQTWTSGYGRRLMSRGRWFESQRHIPDGNEFFSH